MACSCGRNPLNRTAGRSCAFARQAAATAAACRANTRGGKRIRCGAGGVEAAREAAALAAAARNAQCTAVDTCVCNRCVQRLVCPAAVADELYGGGTATVAVRTTCCDPCGCGEYDIADRNPFWPTFAHPRWLSCEQLYSRGLCACSRR